MVHQVVVELSTSPCIKPGQGNPVGGLGSQNLVKELEIAHVATVRGPTSRPSYTADTYMQRA